MLKLNSGACLGSSLTALAMLALCGGALAEEPAATATAATPKANPYTPKRAPRPEDLHKVFVIKDAAVRELAEVLSIFPASISYDHTVTVNTQGVSSTATALGVSASPAVMAAIEETIKRLDVPPAPAKSVEITAYVLEALAEPVEHATVPAALEPAVGQLKRTFRYATYRLADTLVMRGTADGSGYLSVDAVSEAELSPHGRARYHLAVQRAVAVSTAGRDSVRLQQLRFRAQIPAGPNQTDSQLEIWSNVDIGDGQTVIVGKSGTGQPGSAVILVLSAKIVD